MSERRDTRRRHQPARKEPTPPSTRLSTPLWLLKHTQGITTTATALAILHLRTAHVLFYTSAILATSFTAKGLKRIIKQPRPPGSRVKKTSGMPSTHSSSVSFMGGYLLLCLLHPASSFQPATHGGGGGGGFGRALTLTLGSTLCIVLPASVMWSRVRLGVHTPAQTIVGAMLGLVKAGFWFTVWYGTDKVWGVGGPAGMDEVVGRPLDSWIHQWERRVMG